MIFRNPVLVSLITGLASLSAITAMGANLACPTNQTPDNLERWRRTAIESTFGQNLSSNPYAYGYGISNQAEQLTRSIETCFPTQIPACLQRVHDFAQQQWAANLPAAPESEEQKKRRMLPSEFWDQSSVVNGVPQRYVFSQKIPGTNNYKDIEAIAREKGWPIVRYKTRMSGGFDTTPSLMMIRVPGKKLTPPVNYDQYVNIPIPQEPHDLDGPVEAIQPVPQQRLPLQSDYGRSNGGYSSLPSTVTVVTVEKKDGDTPAKVYFTFYRNYSDTPYFTQETPPPNIRSSCYSCHPNGVRAISPYGYHVRQSEVDAGHMKPEDMWQATLEMNNSMNTNNGFSAVDWGKVVDPSGKQRPALNPAAMGPVYGPVHPLNRRVVRDDQGHPRTVYPTRTKEYIVGENGRGGCARNFGGYGGYGGGNNQITLWGRGAGRANIFTMTENPPINWEKVRDNMSCASCHNNRIRGSINSATDFKEIAFKILVDQSMPVGVHTDPTSHNGSVHDDLNPNERIALANCLREEFNTESTMMSQWLNQVSCSGNQNGTVESAINDMFPQTSTPPAGPVPAQGVSNRRVPPAGSRQTGTPSTQPSPNGRAF